MNINYQRQLDKIIEDIINKQECPSLLLHACCAPCSSYVLEYLSKYFSITLLYYNPNIYPESEYLMRLNEVHRLVDSLPCLHPVTVLDGRYIPKEFFNIAQGHENDPERGERCLRCYQLRLEEAAKTAVMLHSDYFTTTLTISPLKDSESINKIGEDIALQYNVQFLPSDFKKKNGYKRSIELSAEYNLYRQNFCGCIYSKH